MPKVSDAHLRARRQQILQAAATCFARDGFHRTSMQDIVRESGISAGLVYRYFAGKDDMIAAIVSQWHERRGALIEAVHNTPEEGRHPGRLAPVYLDLLRAIGSPQAVDDLRLGVQVWAEAVRTPQIRDLVRRGVDGPLATVADLIRQAQRRGELRADLDADALVRVLIAVYQGLMLQTVWDDTVDNDAFVRAVEAVLDALVRH
jgi:AcrR family transcriptional regulator